MKKLIKRIGAMVDRIKIAFNKMIHRVFKFVWRKWLQPDDSIVRILGWRSAIIADKYGARKRSWFCFRFMGREWD